MVTSRTQRLSKSALVVGYLASLASVILAHRSPATGYELSLYWSTPTSVWVGIGVAAVVGLAVSLLADGRIRDGGILLCLLSALSVFSLPIVRGYYFYGAGDSLSHLGWAREIAAGQIEPTNLLYPAIHVLTVALGEVGGVSLALSNLYVVLVVFPLVFLLFVPLCVQLLAGTRRALAFGMLAAVLFAPINNVSIHPLAHPASQAILFLPFVLFVVFRYVSSGNGSTRLLSLWRPRPNSKAQLATPFGILLAVVSAAVVFIHPQQALNVIVLFAAIAGTQAIYRLSLRGHPITSHRPMYLQTALIAGVFLAWAPRFETVTGSFWATVASVLGGNTEAGAVVAAKSQSLAGVGGDILVLFFRLFFPSVVLSILAGVLIVVVLANADSPDQGTKADGLLLYLAISLVPLFAVFVFFVASATGDMYFRYQGFIMVPVTILAAVALSKARVGMGSDATWLPVSRKHVSLLVVVLFLLLFPFAGAGLHPSPHIYQPTPDVTQTQMDGYAASFQYRVPDQEFTGIRGGPRRYVDAAYGTNLAETTLDFPGYEDRLPERVFNRGTYEQYYDDDQYLAVTAANRATELRLYRGFRYGPQGFRRLETNPAVHRIRANEDFQLYYVDGEDQ